MKTDLNFHAIVTFYFIKRLIYKPNSQIFNIILILNFMIFAIPKQSFGQLVINANSSPKTNGVVFFSTLTSTQKNVAKSSGIIVQKGGHLNIDEDISFDADFLNLSVEVGDNTLSGGIMEVHAILNLSGSFRDLTLIVRGDITKKHFIT